MPARGIFILLILVLLYVGHSAFVPVALALLFGLILSSPVEALHRFGLSRGLGALLMLVAVFIMVAGLVALLWNPAQEWYASAPHTLATIQKKITPLARIIGHVQELTHRAGAVGSSHPGTEPTVAVAQDNLAIPGAVLGLCAMRRWVLPPF